MDNYLEPTLGRLDTYIAKFQNHSKKSAVFKRIDPIHTQLPLWPDNYRTTPNTIMRSALFTAKNKNVPRSFLKNVEIHVIGSGSISYLGEELRQDDASVWMQLLHLAKEIPLGKPIEFSAYSFCKALGWKASGRDYKRLREILSRLQATSLKVHLDDFKAGISFSMLPKFEFLDASSNSSLKYYTVSLDPELVKLFNGNHYTRVEWMQRLSLPVGIATWLHGYLASHKKNYPIKLETIKAGCGIQTKSNKHLKSLIAKALSELQTCGFILSFSISQSGLVHIERS